MLPLSDMLKRGPDLAVDNGEPSVVAANVFCLRLTKAETLVMWQRRGAASEEGAGGFHRPVRSPQIGRRAGKSHGTKRHLALRISRRERDGIRTNSPRPHIFHSRRRSARARARCHNIRRSRLPRRRVIQRKVQYRLANNRPLASPAKETSVKRPRVRSGSCSIALRDADQAHVSKGTIPPGAH